MRFFDRSRHVFRYRSNIFHVSCLSSFPKNNLNNVTIIPILPVVSNQTCDGCSSLTVNSVLRSKNQYLPVKIATASSSHNQIRQFTTATGEKPASCEHLTSVYQDFACACRLEDGLVTKDVKFEFDTCCDANLLNPSATNIEKYVVKITRWGDEYGMPFFSTDIENQDYVVGMDCIIEPQDAHSLRLVERVFDSLFENLTVEFLGAEGIGKTCVMMQYLIRLLRNMGMKYRPEDNNDHRRYSSEVYLRTSEENAFRFFLSGDQVKVERLEHGGDLVQLCKMFRERTRAARNAMAADSVVPPTLLLELSENGEDTSNHAWVGRVIVTSSVRNVSQRFSTIEKNRGFDRVMMEPYSEGMMLAAVRGLVAHSKYRKTDSFLSQFLDQDGKEIEGKICEVVRERYFNVGGFMRDLICAKQTHQMMADKTKYQARIKQWSLMQSINFPAQINYLVMPIHVDPNVPNSISNVKVVYRSNLAAITVSNIVATLQDVENLREAYMYSTTVAHAWRYAALLDKSIFQFTSPDSWRKDKMQFFTDPGHSNVNKTHRLCGKKILKFPQCQRIVSIDNTMWKHGTTNKIRDFQDGVLYAGRSSFMAPDECFTVNHDTKTVTVYCTSDRTPSYLHTKGVEYSNLEVVMGGIGMFAGEGTEYKLCLCSVVVDDKATNLATGWTFTHKREPLKICDLGMKFPEKYTFPPKEGSSGQGEDRVHGIIVKFLPWGDAFYAKGYLAK